MVNTEFLMIMMGGSGVSDGCDVDDGPGPSDTKAVIYDGRSRSAPSEQSHKLFARQS